MKEEEPEYDIIQNYITATEPTWRNVKLLDVFRVDREGEVRRRVHYMMTSSPLCPGNEVQCS